MPEPHVDQGLFVLVGALLLAFVAITLVVAGATDGPRGTPRVEPGYVVGRR